MKVDFCKFLQKFAGKNLRSAGHKQQILASIIPLGQPEVNQLDLVGRLRDAHDVLRLQVQMDDMLAVDVANGFADLKLQRFILKS